MRTGTGARVDGVDMHSSHDFPALELLDPFARCTGPLAGW